MILVTQDGRQGTHCRIHYCSTFHGSMGWGVQLVGCLQFLWMGETHWVLPGSNGAGAFPPSLHQPLWLKLHFSLFWSCKSSSQSRSRCRSLPLQPAHTFPVPSWGSNKSICMAAAQHTCWGQCSSQGLRAPGKQAQHRLWFCKKNQS